MSPSTTAVAPVGRADDVRPTGARYNSPPRWRRALGLKGAGFTAPFFLGFLFVTVIPLAVALKQSVYQKQNSGLGLGSGTVEWAGFANYAKGLTSPTFWAGMERVALFGVVMIPLGMAISISMALLLDALSGRTAKGFRVGLLVPYMVPGIVATLIWLYLYSAKVGPLAPLFRAFGVNIDFFSRGTVWPSMGNIMIWGGIGFTMLLLYGSLRSIPRELFDAARVDGASEFRIAWAIKLPYLRGIIVLTTVLQIIGTLQIFNEPVLFRSVSPETVSAQWVPVQQIYYEAFTNNDPYYAAALSVILAVIVGLASFIFYRVTNRPTL